MRKNAKIYATGDEKKDALIAELAGVSPEVENQSLISEILTTAIKIGLENRDKGDLKLVNSALKELRYSLKIFSPHRNVRKVVIFGSARSDKKSGEYRLAEEFAEKITSKGYMIVTGGGPGVMEAGNKGAMAGKDFALNIRLPYEQKPNPYVSEKERLINYKYFFIRKLFFIKETDAIALFPGGFGTHDETFEILTLIQTGKSKPRPIVLIEPKGSSYWATWKRFIKNELLKNRYIDRQDMSLFYIANTASEAVEYIEKFYSTYHSIRYVSDLTVLRLNREISSAKLIHINRNFKNILKEGSIEMAGPTDKELKEHEYPDLPRLIMKFNRRDYGRLYELIHALNAGCQET